ncbi:MAG: hypothetical protein ABSE89_06750 [Sedimentisphaerales bacterium]
MKKLVTICAVLTMVLAVSGVVQATMLTYAIVDHPAYQIDVHTGFVDSVSGTIIADPTTGIIDSASFTITGQTGSYTVANAIIDNPYYIHITPTQIYLTSSNPSNPYNYGSLGLRNRTDGGYPNVGVYWYLLGEGDNLSWPTLHYSEYNGWYKLGKKDVIADFGEALGDSPWVVATVVPEPATICLLAFGAISLLRKK